MSKFLPQFLVVLAVSLSFALFRRFAPRNSAEEHVSDNGKRLPYGVAGACMWFLGIAIVVGGFFALRTANHLLSFPDHNTLFVAYPPQVIWMFLPGFAALAIPWVVTLWLLRHFGYAGQAAEIVEDANQKGGFNAERVMTWLIWIVVVPIGSVYPACNPNASRGQVRSSAVDALRTHLSRPVLFQRRATCLLGRRILRPRWTLYLFSGFAYHLCRRSASSRKLSRRRRLPNRRNS